MCRDRWYTDGLWIRTPKDILDAVNYIQDKVDQLPTKEDVLTMEDVREIVREELRDVRNDVKAIRTDLDDLKEKFDNVTGYRKEINYALERIAGIEKHLGIDKKITA